jgi:hypothetical protein
VRRHRQTKVAAAGSPDRPSRRNKSCSAPRRPRARRKCRAERADRGVVGRNGAGAELRGRRPAPWRLGRWRLGPGRRLGGPARSRWWSRLRRSLGRQRSAASGFPGAFVARAGMAGASGACRLVDTQSSQPTERMVDRQPTCAPSHDAECHGRPSEMDGPAIRDRQLDDDGHEQEA